MRSLRSDVKSLWQAFVHQAVDEESGAEQPCFGTIDKKTSAVTYESYGEVHERARALAFALKRKLGVGAGDNVGIYGRNCASWMLAELGVLARGAVPVALYDSLGPDAVAYSVNHAAVSVIFCEHARYDTAIRVASMCESVKHIVVFGGSSERRCAAQRAVCFDAHTSAPKCARPAQRQSARARL